MATSPRDRLALLLGQATFNGIDFVEVVSSDQKTLLVHFLNAVPMQGTVSAVSITGGETVPTVTVNPIDNATDWSLDTSTPQRPLLSLTVPSPGDFSFYTLTLVSSVLDAYFNHVSFSFKARCPSDLDCESPAVVCPPLPDAAPPIDYLAKDFLSMRKALSDFSALRYPEWQERAEADFGVMFMEALSGLADDLSYTQDRVAAEATLETATQRRSIVRHARLVDYEPQPAVASGVILQFDVSGANQITSGVLVSAQLPEAAPIYFETGTLVDPDTGLLNHVSYPANPLWNRAKIQPYWWDDSQRCLPAGASEMWVVNHSLSFFIGQSLLIDTNFNVAAEPPIREIVTLARFDELSDPLVGSPPPTPVTHLVFGAPTQFSHDLTVTSLCGNIVPATQGRRVSTELFAIDTAPAANQGLSLAVVRTGPNDTPDDPSLQYLYTLKNAPLTCLPQTGAAEAPLPELLLNDVSPGAGPWVWRSNLLEAEPFENSFTIDPAAFNPTGRDISSAPVQDYDGDGGNTIRFGDGTFGGIPDSGHVFSVLYRVGSGAIGNVAADSVVKVEPGGPSWVSAVTNPFAASGGLDEESEQQVKRLAPQAFRAVQYRALRAEDYVAAAETLPWVLRAGSAFRWTGSWLTVFTTADPKGSETITVAQNVELIDLLNRYRMAGYETYAPVPRYVSLDLYVYVCALPDAFRGDVEAAILEVLSSQKFADRSTGFFYTDHFSFGIPLERSELEAVIQAVDGVAGVSSIEYRQRGVTPIPVEMGDTVQVAPDQIIRVDNDPSRPESGSLHVEVDGGK